MGRKNHYRKQKNKGKSVAKANASDANTHDKQLLPMSGIVALGGFSGTMNPYKGLADVGNIAKRAVMPHDIFERIQTTAGFAEKMSGISTMPNMFKQMNNGVRMAEISSVTAIPAMLRQIQASATVAERLMSITAMPAMFKTDMRFSIADSVGNITAMTRELRSAHDGLGIVNIATAGGIGNQTKYFRAADFGGIMASSGLQSTSFSALKLAERSSMLMGAKAIQNIGSPTVLANLASTMAYTRSAENMLTSFAWDKLGTQVGLSANLKSAIGTSFWELSTRYSDVLNYFKTSPTAYLGFSPIIGKAIPVEYYTCTKVLEVITNSEETLIVENTAAEIQYENEYALNLYLPKLHPGLLNMWKGAIETYNSTNSDKIRQFTVSIRELFTHIIHSLAPDDVIKQWTTDTTLFHEGRPTRKARLSYICRNIAVEPFKKFVDKDIQATLAFIDIFQEGTHNIEPTFRPSQLLAMKSKAESTLKFLIEIEFSANRA